MPVTRISDLMTPVVQTLHVGDTLARAAQLMHHARIRHLPIVDAEERVVGLITHRRILSAWVSHGDPDAERVGEVAREVPVEMLMEKNVLTAPPDLPAAEAARLLERHKIGCLPVVERGKLVGIITETDFVRFAREFFERQSLEP